MRSSSARAASMRLVTPWRPSGNFSPGAWTASDLGLEVSPCAGIRDKTLGISARDLQRTRVLGDQELFDLWCGVEALGSYGHVVRLLMLTGQRVGDIANARWDEVDFAAGELNVPASRFKSGVAQKVPLPPRALAILRDDLPRSDGFVFSTTSGRRPITVGSKLKESLDDAIAARRKREGRAAMPSWTLHDIRRTVRTRLVGDCAVEAYIAERILGHALPGLHKVYDQGTHMGAKAEALVRWEARLMGIVEPGATTPPASITQLSTRRRRKQAA